MTEEALVAFCTFPDADTATKIAREIIESRLAACGNVIPAIHSIYWWQGKIESADESLAIFKLPGVQYAEFEAKLRALHPYDVPEIVSFRMDNALPDYVRWILESCSFNT